MPEEFENHFDSFDSQAEKIQKEAESLRSDVVDFMASVVLVDLTLESISNTSLMFKKGAKKILQKSVKSYEQEAESLIRAGLAKNLSKSEINLIFNESDVMLDTLSMTNQKMVRDIRNIGLSILTSDLPTSKALEKIKEISPNYPSNVSSTVVTSLQKTLRAVTFQDQLNGGATKFIYAGPRDEKNRPYCGFHVGKTYSVAESKIHYQKMQTFYRCRHSLFSI